MGLQGNHKFYTSFILHKINLTSTKLTLKSFDNQPLQQKRNREWQAMGFFPSFVFFTLIKLRQQKVTRVFFISHLEKLKNYRGINLLVPHIRPNTQ